ncbi:MAG: cation:proton antiporter domain-containing protein [Armatimonadota bacterium]
MFYTFNFTGYINSISTANKSSSTFNDIVLLLVLAAIFGLVAMRMRQPLIIGFIIVGIMAGPSVFNWPAATGEITLLAELGLSLLLFVVGLKLDLRLIRSIGKVAAIAGIGQVVLTAGFGYLISIWLGMTGIMAMYSAIAMAFSSTIIIVKLLSDKKETDSLHGRITVGILIIQDIVVVLVMILITAFSGEVDGGNLGMQMLLIIGKGTGLIVGLAILMYYVIPRLFASLAKSPELLVLASVAWAFSMAYISELLGFSKEVGAFLAGVALASTAYREIIGARLVSLRDFLLLFFFVNLGMSLNLGALQQQIWKAIPLSLFVLIAKPLITSIILSLMGYRKRTSFLSGIMLAQISEFSLILVALGYQLKHINEATVSLITLSGIITIGISSYLILYANEIFQYFSPRLKRFERGKRHKDQEMDADLMKMGKVDIIFFGLGRYGTVIAESLIKDGYSLLAIDFDPQVVEEWNVKGGTALFGDAEDQEFPSMLPIATTNWIISAISIYDINASLIKSLKHHGYNGNIAVTAYDSTEVEALQNIGADVVFQPYADAALEAADAWISADNLVRRKKMDAKISKLNEHYIVCGYGRMGQQIVRDFNHHKIPYVVVESNKEQLPKLIANNILYVEGNASDDDVLLAAGIERAKGLIAVNATDEDNVFIVLSARGLNPSLFIVARSIMQENEDKLRRAGANRVMSPYILGGNRMALAVLRPEAIELFGLQINGNQIQIEIADISLPDVSCVLSKTIADSGLHQIPGIALVAVRHPDGRLAVNPTPEYELQCGDEIIITGTISQIDEVKKLIAQQV